MNQKLKDQVLAETKDMQKKVAYDSKAYLNFLRALIEYNAKIQKIERDKARAKFKGFNVVAWIHPKNGGDDYQVDLQIEAESKAGAKTVVEKYLKRKSAITNDYAFV